jgi:putative transposase
LPDRRPIWHAQVVRRYESGGQTKHRLLYHIVWVPKYRKRILIGKVVVRLRELLYEAAEVRRWWIHELNIREDHIHMLLQIPPATSVADAVQVLKGGTSFIIRRDFPELAEWLWQGSLWADGYFAESVGIAHETAVRRYIQQQHDLSVPS